MMAIDKVYKQDPRRALFYRFREENPEWDAQQIIRECNHTFGLSVWRANACGGQSFAYLSRLIGLPERTLKHLARQAIRRKHTPFHIAPTDKREAEKLLFSLARLF